MRRIMVRHTAVSEVPGSRSWRVRLQKEGEPPEGPLHHPSPLENFKALLLLGLADDFQNPAEAVLHPADEFACVAAVNPDELQAWKAPPGLFQQEPDPVPVPGSRRMNHDEQAQPHGVGQRMAFVPLL